MPNITAQRAKHALTIARLMFYEMVDLINVSEPMDIEGLVKNKLT